MSNVQSVCHGYANETVEIRSNVRCPLAAGVYEDARHAYLHEVLIRRVGCPAALAVIYGDTMRRLLTVGVLKFGVRVECSNLDVLPTAEVPIPSPALAASLTLPAAIACTQDIKEIKTGTDVHYT